MIRISSHKERVSKVKNFANSNKLFTVIAVVVAVFLLGNFLLNRFGDKNDTPSSSSENTRINEDNKEEQSEHWRFYWSDFFILVIGGGFCSVMIIKERRKAKEKLK